MRKLIAVVLFALVAYGGYRIWDFYTQQARITEPEEEEGARRPRWPGGVMPGMDTALNDAYKEAQGRGALGLKQFLDRHRGSPLLVDPRLADIQLDYVLLVSVTNPEEAKQMYAEVEKRVKPGSPVFGRMRELRKNFR
jgi:hypothetical protein